MFYIDLRNAIKPTPRTRRRIYDARLFKKKIYIFLKWRADPRKGERIV